MNLTFNQIEAVFRRRFDIPEAKLGAFRGRLQHLQRLGFPDGANTGRGTKANYGWVQIIQLTIVLDLIDFGMMPDVAVRAVRKRTDTLVEAVCRVIEDFGTPAALAKALLKARCPFGSTRMAVISAYALTSHEAEKAPLLMTCTGREFTEQLTKDPAVEPAALYIDLGSRTMLIGQLVGRVADLEPPEVASKLSQWANHWLHQDTLS